MKDGVLGHGTAGQDCIKDGVLGHSTVGQDCVGDGVLGHGTAGLGCVKDGVMGHCPAGQRSVKVSFLGYGIVRMMWSRHVAAGGAWTAIYTVLVVVVLLGLTTAVFSL